MPSPNLIATGRPDIALDRRMAIFPISARLVWKIRAIDKTREKELIRQYPERKDKAMVATNRSSGKSDAGRAVARELDQLKEKVKDLALKLEREAKAREIATRLAAQAKKAREQLTREIKALREQGRKMASELKSAITDADKRKQTVEEARGKIAELRAELSRTTADLKYKSKELKKLAGESAHRAAAIIRGAGQSAAEPAQPSAESRPSEPGPEDHPSDKPTPT
jgi:chromosome segregation ATPase